MISLGDILLTALLTVFASAGAAIGLLWRYKKKVEQMIRMADAGRGEAEAEGAARRTLLAPPELKLNVYASVERPGISEEAHELLRHARFTRYTAVAIYALAGFAHVFTTLLVLLHLKGRGLISGYALLAGTVLLWPVGLTFAVVWGTRLREDLLLFVLYLIALPLAWVLSGVSPEETYWDDLSVAGLLVLVAAPAFITYLTMNRRLKTVGTLALVCASVIAAGVLAGLWFKRAALNLGVLLAALMWIYLPAAVAAALWLTLQGIIRRYRERRSSDQSMILGTFWLLQTEMFAIVFAAVFGWEGLLAAGAYMGYVLTLVAGFYLRRRLLRRRAARLCERLDKNMRARLCEDEGGFRLLLLRLFKSGRGSLLQRLEARWRYVGSIQLIAGPDLAKETIEPDESFDFLTRRLGSRVVKGAEDMRDRISRLDLRADPDGRYRVNEFFCYVNTWQMAVAELLKQSDVVLMDLRGFPPWGGEETRGRRAAEPAECEPGVIVEIGMVVNTVPFSKLVIVTDRATQQEKLCEVIKGKWRSMDAASPNFSPHPAEANILRVEGQSSREIERVVAALLEAARTPLP